MSSESEESLEDGACPICERTMPLTRHHVYPKETHKRFLKRKKNRMTKEELSRTIDICRPCHSHLHRTFDNMQLALRYNTLDALMEDEQMQRYAKWQSKQRSHDRVPVKYRR